MLGRVMCISSLDMEMHTNYLRNFLETVTLKTEGDGRIILDWISRRRKG
jgi:hypothetical protein